MQVRGYEGNLFNTLAEAMNFTPVILTPPSALWGDELHNGSWTGIHGNIKNGIADVGFCQVLPMASRLHFEEYSVPITTDTYIWILPEVSPINWNKLLVPFKMNVWICLGVATLAATVFVYCSAKYSNVEPNLLFLWAYFFGQDIGRNYKKHGMIIPRGMWLLFAFFISNAYLASLTNSLTFVIPAGNVETVKELLENGIPFGGASTLRDFYKNFDDADDYEIYRKYENVPLYKLIPLFFRIVNGSLNFATPLSKRSTITYKKTGQFHVMNERVLYYHNTFAFPRGSPYIDEFNLQIERIKSGGFIELWLSRNTTGLVSNATSSQQPLRLIHMSSIFTMWSIGLMLSIITFLLEILSHDDK
ncbi:glutamate receptor ionotropic, delta-1-like [Cephus cinctus]|uniref:Glutamate receptor ionotropic, delta-1-like n=1 Tax=Cephus cinctus TaxID=211228 RepID=A0AAJ7RT89_CEPCN|nr:glutamate receptor ionotropic, delta-1-like [Cephus cinctus]